MDMINFDAISTNFIGYINIYQKEFGLFKAGWVYSTREEAMKIAKGDDEYYTTIKIEF